jgi:hypothetical protein
MTKRSKRFSLHDMTVGAVVRIPPLESQDVELTGVHEELFW